MDGIRIYREDERPWLAGFTGNAGPGSARPGPKALRPYNGAVLSVPAGQRKKPVAVPSAAKRA